MDPPAACTVPPADMTPADGGGVAPAAGASDNPVLASVDAGAPAGMAPDAPAAAPDGAAPAANGGGGSTTDGLGFIKNLGKVISTTADTLGLKGGATPFGGLMSLPADAAAGAKGIDELSKGKIADGVLDTTSGVAATASDIAKIAGDSDAAKPLTALKGGATFAKGAMQMYQGVEAENQELAPGTYGIDGKSKEVDGFENMLSGAGDMASAAPNPLLAAGKGLSVGMAGGKLLAPLVYGTPDNSPHMEKVPEDGIYYPTTGNKYVDKLFGVGRPD